MSQTVDSRSQNNLDTLRPKARLWFVPFLLQAKAKAAESGLDVRIISGNRTWSEQDELYKQGRTTPGDIVTYAQGGQSNHNYGIAVDIGVFRPNTNGKASYLSSHALYKTLGPIGEALGLEWGGRWKKPVDTPHYQIATGKTSAQLMSLVSSQGWGALDALIPTFGAPQPPPPAPTPVGEPVLVVLDTDSASETPPVPLALDAWFLAGRTWVSLTDWCDYFGGNAILSSADEASSAKVVLKDRKSVV